MTSNMSTCKQFLSTKKKSKDSYEFIENLGEGSFAEVVLVAKVGTPNKMFAMKEISIVGKDECFMESIKRECSIQKRLSKSRHLNMIHLFEIRTNPENYQLILSYADGGDLFEKINQHGGLGSDEAHRYFKQLIDGLRFIHEEGVTHRDIKPENLLLTKSGILKIADFGFATMHRFNGAEQMLNAYCGSPPYIAPEVLTGIDYRGPAVDIWSAGVVLIAMIAGAVPWEQADHFDIFQSRYCSFRRNGRKGAWSRMSQQVISLLRKILLQAELRATISMIEEDPWFIYGEEVDAENKENGSQAQYRQESQTSSKPILNFENLLKDLNVSI
ncbi:non-specific serine/threonine protein kinase [Caenorhabditis elegans]|uniref:non-specific serine/threonine protein kinase n=1 Tax=Caenorhabditis elegans TaxID=6239 RepID=Q86S44_CAEEL|nr:Protein kinase domain-containing protein [Caenorhabditis elegans]CCD68554.2 Protein kinase domain-containing protein [Caenorhabditis elegans]